MSRGQRGEALPFSTLAERYARLAILFEKYKKTAPERDGAIPQGAVGIRSETIELAIVCGSDFPLSTLYERVCRFVFANNSVSLVNTHPDSLKSASVLLGCDRNRGASSTDTRDPFSLTSF